MSLKSRLRKIEEKVGEKSIDFAPIMIILYEDDNEEEIIKKYKAKYGEDYSPRIVLKSTMRREEAEKSGGLLSPDFPKNLINKDKI
jgi:hypothetical protein